MASKASKSGKDKVHTCIVFSVFLYLYFVFEGQKRLYSCISYFVFKYVFLRIFNSFLLKMGQNLRKTDDSNPCFSFRSLHLVLNCIPMAFSGSFSRRKHKLYHVSAKFEKMPVPLLIFCIFACI